MLWVFYRGLLARLKVESQSCTIVTPYMPELDALVDATGCNRHEVTIRRSITPLADVYAILRLAMYLRKERFDMVHAHTPKGGFIGMLAARLAGTPVRVYTVHGLPLETARGLKRRLLRFVDSLACACANHVLAVSPSLLRKILDERVCTRDKLRVLGDGSACGIDIDYYSLNESLKEAGRALRRNHGIDDDAVVLGYIGRIGPEKGIDNLVSVFPAIRANRKIAMVLAGEMEVLHGRLRPETELELANNHSIVRLDHIQDVRPVYAATDVLVLPTLREGLGMALLEAGAMGLPVVATRVTGCVDAVVDGQTGLLVEPENTEQLKAALITLIDDPQLRQKLGEQARIRVSQMFDSARLIEAHLAFYREVLKNE